MGSAGWEEASSRNQNQSSWSCPYLRLQALKTRCREVLASPATLGAHYPAPQLHYDSLPLSWSSLEAGKGHCEPLPERGSEHQSRSIQTEAAAVTAFCL